MRRAALFSLLVPLWLALWLTACSALGSGSDSDQAVIASDTLPADGATGDGTSGGVGDGAGDVAGDRGNADAAPGSTDLSPELSTDPDIVYVPGTCFTVERPGDEAVELPCDEPHTIEVYANRDLPGGLGAPFLGLDAAVDLCQEDFQAITGVGLGLATIFERLVLRPSEETWAVGERDVTCYVVYPEPVVDRLADVDPVRAFDRVSVYGLEPGDCLADFEEAAPWYTLVPCGEAHDAEVFVDHEYPEGPFPGDAAIDELADDLCFGPTFEQYVGLPYPDSSVYSLRSRPTGETWALGDRTINCILTDETIHADSFRNSGL